MVVLSGAICTKSGKALIARQFVEMTRIRIEVDLHEEMHKTTKL